MFSPDRHRLDQAVALPVLGDERRGPARSARAIDAVDRSTVAEHRLPPVGGVSRPASASSSSVRPAPISPYRPTISPARTSARRRRRPGRPGRRVRDDQVIDLEQRPRRRSWLVGGRAPRVAADHLPHDPVEVDVRASAVATMSPSRRTTDLVGDLERLLEVVGDVDDRHAVARSARGSPGTAPRPRPRSAPTSARP